MLLDTISRDLHEAREELAEHRRLATEIHFALKALSSVRRSRIIRAPFWTIVFATAMGVVIGGAVVAFGWTTWLDYSIDQGAKEFELEMDRIRTGRRR